MTDMPGTETSPGERSVEVAFELRVIDGSEMREAADAGMAWLAAHKETVNALNVFPVPDGDTGTNMLLTMKAACQEIESLVQPTAGEVVARLAHGALMGARGNSGVILSQLWRGFALALESCKTLEAPDLARALRLARDQAYQSVVRPVEGTILTVANDAAVGAEAAVEAGMASVTEVLARVVEAANASLLRTPELLPVLKEAGVVDAGGKGLVVILEGMLRYARRQSLEAPVLAVPQIDLRGFDEAMHAAEPGQDWEVVMDFRPARPIDPSDFYTRLESMGTSIQVGEGDNLYRVHIHVAEGRQYEPIEYARELGVVTKVALENLVAQMEDQARAAPKPPEPEPGHIAAVAVAPGPGIERVFASLGAAVVPGGQSMNPSTADILAAIEAFAAEEIVVLPNNKNVVASAEQAAALSKKPVRVVPSRSVPQGIAALLRLDPAGTLDEVSAAMRSALSEVRTIELATATRTVRLDGLDVLTGQQIGVVDGKLMAVHDELGGALLAALEACAAQEAQLVTLYRGADLRAEECAELVKQVLAMWPGLEVEVHDGGQPHYSLIVSVE